MREAPLVATGKISESAVLFFRHVLRTFAAFTCLNSKPLRNSGLVCYLPLCREVRKILLIPIGYDKA